MKQNQEYILIAGGSHLQRELIVTELNNLGIDNHKFIDIETNKQLRFTDLIQKFQSLLQLYPFEKRPQINEDKVKWVILQSQYQQSKNKKVVNGEYARRKFIYQQKKLKQIGSYYGVPILNIHNKANEQIIQQIVILISSENYLFVRNFQMRSMTYEKLFNMDIEKLISTELYKKTIDIPKSLIQQLTKDGVFGNQILDLSQNKPEFKMKLISKWLVAGQITVQNGIVVVQRQNIKVQVNQKYVLLMSMQGQSKMLFKVISSNNYFNNFVFIVLKSTIYSHKKQATGEIQNLGKIRAYGSKIFLEFLNRNDLNHAYRCVNQEGIIFSQFQQISPIQIVFKKYYIGTDKHSYYGMKKLHQIVEPQDEKYKTGIYIRFDWRNPNHISTKTQTDLTQNPYYYLIQSELTKNIFFDKYLTNTQKAIPYGDKCVYPELVEGIIDVNKARFNLIKLYCSFEYYMHQVGLEVLDGCFMLDVEANTFWSEINPDCMRIKSNNLKEEYDKDIWRTGGSSSKEVILKKWMLLNDILTNYLLNHRDFLSKDYPYKQTASQILKSPNLLQNYKYIYQQLVKPKKTRRQIIATIDISKQMPSLVVSSNISQTHSQGNVFEALQKVKYFDEILVVNLDGAFGDIQNSTKNIKIIKAIAKKHQIMTGGGIHNIKLAQNLLNNGIGKIVVATNTSSEFLSQIPSNRVIVQLSINQYNQVLIDGRKTNTKINITHKIQQLIKLGIRIFSITFVKKQGHLKGLPYEQIQQLISNLPNQVQKLIIAGGITTLNDLRFLWKFENVVPQLGSAIWKQKISIGQIFKQIANFNEHGLIPAVIKSTTNVIKGQIFLNQQSLIKTVETGYLHRYSRKHKNVMKKGDTSGDIQKVLRVSFDCDADSLLITVDSQRKFCHLNLKSCYHCQNMSLNTINQISQHIKNRKNQKSYSAMMQTNPGLALVKLFEQIWELTYVNQQHKLSQCADLIAHFLMYANGLGIQFEDITKELSFRTNVIKKAISSKSSINTEKIIVGLTNYQHQNQIEYKKILQQIGIIIIMQNQIIQYQITSKQKYQHYFKHKNIEFIRVDSLDVSWLLTIGLIDMVICLNTTIQNYPQVSIPCIQIPISDFKLCLLKRRNSDIKLQQFLSSQKINISSHFIKSTHNYLTTIKNLSHDVISIHRVHRNNQYYLLNQSHCNISLCDALVYQSNINPKLQIFETIIPEGQIKVGLYKSIRL